MSVGSTPTLKLSGLTTGLDTSSIIQQLMAVEKRPVIMMQNKVTKDQAQLAAYQAINTKLMALQTAAQALSSGTFNLSPMAAKTATSGNTALFSATASSTATAGSYNVTINALAQAQKTGGGTFSYAGGAGTIRINGSDGSSVSLAVAAGSSISTIADTINQTAGSQFNAGVINSGGSNVLVLTAKNSGTTYTIDDGAAGSYGFTSTLGISTDGTTNPSATNFTYQAAQQASMTVDGKFNFTSNTNQFVNSLPGVTINAVAAGSSTLTIGQDNSAAVSAVQNFVSAFNGVVSELQADTKYDATAKKGGPLLGDSFVANLSSQLTGFLTQGFNLNTGGTYAADPTYNSYNAAGISVQRDGSLSVDTTKLTSALTTDPNKVFSLFAQQDTSPTGTATDSFGKTYKTVTPNMGIAARINGFVDTLINIGSAYNPTSDAQGDRVKGSLLGHIDGINANITDINTQITHYNQLLALRQQTLEHQFLAMEKSVSKIKNQGSQLSGQFAQMSGGAYTGP